MDHMLLTRVIHLEKIGRNFRKIIEQPNTQRPTNSQPLRDTSPRSESRRPSQPPKDNLQKLIEWNRTRTIHRDSSSNPRNPHRDDSITSDSTISFLVHEKRSNEQFPPIPRQSTTHEPGTAQQVHSDSMISFLENERKSNILYPPTPEPLSMYTSVFSNTSRQMLPVKSSVSSSAVPSEMASYSRDGSAGRTGTRRFSSFYQKYKDDGKESTSSSSTLTLHTKTGSSGSTFESAPSEKTTKTSFSRSAWERRSTGNIPNKTTGRPSSFTVPKTYTVTKAPEVCKKPIWKVPQKVPEPAAQQPITLPGFSPTELSNLDALPTYKTDDLFQTYIENAILRRPFDKIPSTPTTFIKKLDYNWYEFVEMRNDSAVNYKIKTLAMKFVVSREEYWREASRSSSNKVSWIARNYQRWRQYLERGEPTAVADAYYMYRMSQVRLTFNKNESEFLRMVYLPGTHKF